MQKNLTNIMMNADSLQKLFTEMHASEEKINRIYYGKDHACRCGCKGTYHAPGDRTYARTLNRLKNLFNHDARKEEIEWHINSVTGLTEYINIPVGEQGADKCFCVYFNN